MSGSIVKQVSSPAVSISSAPGTLGMRLASGMLSSTFLDRWLQLVLVSWHMDLCKWTASQGKLA
jgi:hypothetical protein